MSTTRVVDLHAHVATPACEALLDGPVPTRLDPFTRFSGPETAAYNATLFAGLGGKLSDPAQRIEDMDRTGIDVQALSAAPPQFYYWTAPALGRRLARMQNEHLAELARARPDRFVALATVPLQDVDAAVRELHHGVTELGMRGWRSAPTSTGWIWTTPGSGRSSPRPPRWTGLARLSRLADELAELESLEMGKPRHISRDFDIRFAISSFAFFGGLADKLPGAAIDLGPVVAHTVHEPYGVVAGIIPFNWPPIHTAGKSAPALAAGNCVLLKPPEQDPLTIMRMVELLSSVLPEDVLQVVPGAGPDAGAALAGHPLVEHLSFTGSTATGRAVLKLAADQMTPAVLELGGKNPLVVFDDADLDAAGATVAASAPVPDDPALTGGFWVEPTLFTGVTPDMAVAWHEVFGPVTAVLPFADEEEAVALANDSPYGLLAAVYTANHPRARRTARRIDAGVVMINNFNRALLGTPFGGFKDSGYGREHSIESMLEFTRTKNIREPSGIGDVPEWPVLDELLERPGS